MMRAPFWPPALLKWRRRSEWVHPLWPGALAEPIASQIRQSNREAKFEAGKERHLWHLKRFPTDDLRRRPPQSPTFISFGSPLALVATEIPCQLRPPRNPA